MTTTLTARSVTLEPDARIFQGRSVSVLDWLAKARNSAVLAEPSVVSVSRSDMGMTLAQDNRRKPPVSEMSQTPPLPWRAKRAR